MAKGGEPKTREMLLGAAVEMFGEKGFQMTRISDIVARAGVSQGTFYNYFNSKEEIFKEICNAFVEKIKALFIERTKDIFDVDTAAEVKNNVAAIIEDLFRIYEDNLSVAELLFREGIGNGGLFKEIYEDIWEIFIELIAQQLRIGMEKGFLTTETTEFAAVFVFGLFERSLFYFLLVKKIADTRPLQQAMANFILRGVGFRED